jgi:hypothetical protein
MMQRTKLLPETLLFIVLTLLGVSPLAAQQASMNKNQSKQRTCDPIGRVLIKESQGLKGDSLICLGDRLPMLPGVSLFCYSTGQMINLVGGSIINSPTTCRPRQVRGVICSKSANRICSDSNLRNLSSKKTPEFISPYSSVIIEGRPLIAWHSVKNSKYYVVRVFSKAGIWQKNVYGNSLPYPAEQPALQPGESYRFTITAINEQLSPITTTLAVEMLTEEERMEIYSMEKVIRTSRLSKDEQALDLSALYVSQNLFTEAIVSLQERVKAASRNPQIYRELGELKGQFGMVVDAKLLFEKANELAKSANNTYELEKIKLAMRILKLVQSQEPIKTNELQK